MPVCCLHHCYCCCQVIAGKDKGTVAEIERVVPTRGMVVVKGVNVKVRQNIRWLLCYRQGYTGVGSIM